MTSLQTRNNTYILGIDPGLRHTGWAVVSFSQGKLTFVSAGVVEPPTSLSLSERLAHLSRGIEEVIQKFNPAVVSIEKIFVNKNPATTLILGMARGVVMAVPAFSHIPVMEYAANSIKKTVTSAGHASKAQVAGVLRLTMPSMPSEMTEDATDALAVAVCHAYTMRSQCLHI
ncbi:MAG: crossover junction endodeoxyribonuclease RuvC [Alphaproteobacteria bacterium]|nr:crossover junction endodeoxyribonuclease RuvC [Alphaproteobacteria bacterium]